MESSAGKKPVLAWPQASPASTVTVVADPDECAAADRPCLVEIASPFAQALLRGIDLNEQFANSPELAEAMLQECIDATMMAIAAAREGGAAGVLYLLTGASELHSSPMQYGGRYLEPDRELLESAKQWGFVILLAIGGQGTFVDVVAGLPCHVFGWDVESTGISLAELRSIHSGPTCTSDPDSEWRWDNAEKHDIDSNATGELRYA